MSSRSIHSRTGALRRALLVSLLAAAPTRAGDGLGHAADLRFGPLVGGQPVRLYAEEAHDS